MNVEYLSMFGSSDKRNKHVVDFISASDNNLYIGIY